MLLKRLWAFFLDIVEVVVFAIAIFLFVYLLILQPHKIKGASMEPNYHSGEYLLTEKVSYRFNEPERGDIVVFEAPTKNSEEFIKRIVGLPGESISIVDSTFFVNGKKLRAYSHYLHLKPYIKGKKILEIGSGEGYTLEVFKKKTS